VILVVLYPPVQPPVGAVESLARTTGRAIYEARLWLASPLPHVVGRVADPTEAERAVSSLRASGFECEWIENDALASASEMVVARSPQFRDGGLIANAERGEFLAWEETAVLVLAKSSVAVERTSNETVIEQGPRGSQHVTTRELTRRERSAQNVLYVFPRAGTPWLFEENGIRWAALGIPLLPTRRDNFKRFVDRLRSNAIRATFDDALVKYPPPQFDLVLVRDHEDARAAPNRAMDVAAHLIARRAMRARSAPYR
jgi:hypothetical protein